MFAELVRQKLPQTILRYDIIPGQDHGFDFDEKSWETVRPDAMDFVAKAWLGKS